jgi:hypothetical protein
VAKATVKPSRSGNTGETESCRADRATILDVMAASRRDGTCATDADCATVTGPGHPDPEYAEVVVAADAAALEARAREHLRTCGAFHHRVTLSAYREVAAQCVAGRCAAHETLVHIDE